MKTERKYGTLPRVCGHIDVDPVEMKYWLYCPIKLPRGVLTIPDNLKEFEPIVRAVNANEPDWKDKYVYLTAKRLWVTPDAPGNRPGWHSDGFLTEDINYIWYDCIPTIFWQDGFERYGFVADHEESLKAMAFLCNLVAGEVTYPAKTLLRLDETVLHKCAEKFEPQYRTFVKVSVSDHIYALEGNSINHSLTTNWEYKVRDRVRNCPAQNA